MNTTPSPSEQQRNKLPLLLMAAIAALPPLAVDMYLPAIPQIASMLDTDIHAIQNSLSIFLLGFGLGMLIYGPLSDRHGRRPLALFGLSGFAITSMLLVFSTSSEMFLALRFVQGFVGSAATIVIPAMIRDCYGKDTAKGMSVVTMIMLVAPLLAPLMGSAILTIAPWQGIFFFLALYPAVVLALTWFKLPETKAQTTSTEPRRTLLSNYRIILSKRLIYFDLLSYMMSALSFFTYLTSVSFVYISYYGVSETLFGVLFALSASALILANYINVRIVGRYGPRRLMQVGLSLGVLCALLLLLACSAGLALPWIVLCFFCIVACLGITSVNADALVLIQFPQQASSASAVTGTLRFGFGALAGPLLAWTYDGTPIPVAYLLLGALSIATLSQVLQYFVTRPKQTS